MAISGFTISPTDVTGNSDLAALSNCGGPTQTMIPLLGSAAICAGLASFGAAAGTTSDQRGEAPRR